LEDLAVERCLKFALAIQFHMHAVVSPIHLNSVIPLSHQPDLPTEFMNCVLA